MDWLLTSLSEAELYGWELFIGDYFFVFATLLLVFELLRYLARKEMTKTVFGDVLSNYVTLAMFMGISYVIIAGFYLTAYFWVASFAVFDIASNWATVLICIVLADLAYYWEHRFMHRWNLAWATHSVHHSSPFFNISVAYRFGPMDGIWPIFFHLPLILLGFDPYVVIISEMLVQLYQTLLHTESIKKLPRPIEAIMNTPSHHRVHHGSNPQYLDANYAGIFIIWDKWFGTFAPEEEKVVYGVTEQLNSVNPITIFFHGIYRLVRDIHATRGLGNKLLFPFRGPEFAPPPPNKK